MTPSRNKGIEAATNWSVGLWAVLLLGGGGVVIALPAFINMAEWLEILVLNLGAAVVSVGAVVLLSDLVFKRRFLDEVNERMNVERSIVRVGIAEVKKNPSEEYWLTAFAGASEVEILLSDPVERCRDFLRPLLESAADGKVTARLSVPRPSNDNVLAAHCLRSGSDDVEAGKAALLEVEATYRRGWEGSPNSGKVKSKLHVYRIESLPQFTVVLAGKSVYLVLGEPALERSGQTTLAVRFEDDSEMGRNLGKLAIGAREGISPSWASELGKVAESARTDTPRESRSTDTSIPIEAAFENATPAQGVQPTQDGDGA